MMETCFIVATIAYVATAFVYLRISPQTLDRFGRVLFALKSLCAIVLAIDVYFHNDSGAWIWTAYASVGAAWRIRGVMASLKSGVAPRGVAKALLRPGQLRAVQGNSATSSAAQ